jgi:hypothetical protein
MSLKNAAACFGENMAAVSRTGPVVPCLHYNGCRSKSMFQRTTGPRAQWVTIKKYASEIEKTANGGGRGTLSQTRRAQEIQPQRRFEADGRINVRKAIARPCEDEAEEAPEKKEIAIQKSQRVKVERIQVIIRRLSEFSRNSRTTSPPAESS